MYKKQKPLFRWPGGKFEELKNFEEYFPKNIENYYEPFIGGGSVYLNIEATNYYINDKSTDLINLYKAIKYKKEIFFKILKNIDYYWNSYDEFINFNKIYNQLIEFKDNKINEKNLKENLKEILQGLEKNLDKMIIHYIVFYFKKSLKKGYTFEESYFETAIKAGIYSYVRDEFNSNKKRYEKAAYYYFILQYSFGGLSRFNAKGEFNVPYSGSYNNKKLKLDIFEEQGLLKKFKKTKIDNLDFLKFFEIISKKITKNDFLFLDPPYDCMFNNYDNNPFLQNQQKLLCDYLINNIPCKWMLVISETDFIKKLYFNKAGIYIKEYSKKYKVNIQKRNNQIANHLIISNFELN